MVGEVRLSWVLDMCRVRPIASVVSGHRSDIWTVVWVQESPTNGSSGKAEEGETAQEREDLTQDPEDPILKGEDEEPQNLRGMAIESKEDTKRRSWWPHVSILLFRGSFLWEATLSPSFFIWSEEREAILGKSSSSTRRETPSWLGKRRLKM